MEGEEWQKVKARKVQKGLAPLSPGRNCAAELDEIPVLLPLPSAGTTALR